MGNFYIAFIKRMYLVMSTGLMFKQNYRQTRGDSPASLIVIFFNVELNEREIECPMSLAMYTSAGYAHSDLESIEKYVFFSFLKYMWLIF